jgi:GntR family transcriptional regulator/MocR family aminotransferase
LAPRRPAPLGLALDPALPSPLYQQLFDAIVDRIKSGAFPVGFRLPPTRVLAAELDAHRNTVVRAYSRLEQAGFVGSTVGRGTFVKAVPTAPRQTPLAPESEPSMRWSGLLSERVRAEPFDRLRRITRAAAPSEHVNLTRLQPSPELIPIELFQRCLDHVLRTQGSRALGYTPHEGVPVLREAIAQDLVRRGVPARADDVVVTSGSQQALDVIARGLLEPGDGVLLDEATYTGALQIFTAAGARAEPIAADAEGPIASAVDAVASARRAKLLYLMPGHSNPTGRRIGAERRRELLAISRARTLPIVEDDYAADLELEPEAPVPAMRALDGDVLHVGTYSKKLMPALRIGYLLCPPALREPLVALKHATALGTSSLLQHALAELLERGYLEPHLSKVRSSYRARRDALVEALNAHLPAAFRITPPPRGVTVWVPLPEPLGVEAVFDECRKHGVLVSPGSMYRVGDGARGIRLTYCWESEERLRDGGKRVGQAITSLMRAKKASRPLEASIGLV